MSRQGFACHSTGPIFDWIFRVTFFPIQLPSPFFSLSLSAEWFSSIQFPNETARHKRVSLLFYFIIFIFSFPLPTTCSIFFYWAGIYIMWQTVGRRRVAGSAADWFYYYVLFPWRQTARPLLDALFVQTSKNFLATEVSLFSTCACASVCVCVCVLTWPFIRSSSSAFATNFSFRLRCVLS